MGLNTETRVLDRRLLFLIAYHDEDLHFPHRSARRRGLGRDVRYRRILRSGGGPLRGGRPETDFLEEGLVKCAVTECRLGFVNGVNHCPKDHKGVACSGGCPKKCTGQCGCVSTKPKKVTKT